MIDLMKLFGKRYRVTMDESWEAERPENRTLWSENGEICWYYEIRGKRGYLYLQKENAVALEVSPRIYEKIKKTKPFICEELRSCDEGPTLMIREPNLEAAVKFVGARRKRVLTPEQKARLAEISQKYRFQAKKHGAGDN